MHDFPMPIVELRLKHLGEEMVHAFAAHQGEFTGYIKKAIDDLMSDKFIQAEIDQLCHDCMKECIREVFDSTAVRRELLKIITEQVIARINPTVSTSSQVHYPPVAPTGTGAPLPGNTVISSQTEDEFWTSVKKVVPDDKG